MMDESSMEGLAEKVQNLSSLMERGENLDQLQSLSMAMPQAKFMKKSSAMGMFSSVAMMAGSRKKSKKRQSARMHSLEMDEESEEEMEEKMAIGMMDLDDDEDEMAMMRAMGSQQQLYQEIAATKEYQETFWFNVKYEEGTRGLIPLNKFWCEFGEKLLGEERAEKRGDGDLQCLSQWILLPTANIHEILCCVSLLDLSFSGDGPKYEAMESGNGRGGDDAVRITMDDDDDDERKSAGGGGSIVFLKQFVVEQGGDGDDGDGDEKQRDATISVNVSYFDPLDPFSWSDDGEKFDKFLDPETDSFAPLKLYCCLIVVTNVSSQSQSLKMLVEIPSGSMPCGPNNSKQRTHFVVIGSYSTQKIKFWFYFPESPRSDDFHLYLMLIVVAKHRSNRMVSWTAAQQLRVRAAVDEERGADDDGSSSKSASLWAQWRRLSVSGKYDEIHSFLSSPRCNLWKMEETASLRRIYHLFARVDGMEETDSLRRREAILFWQNVVRLLSSTKQSFYDHVVWSYSLCFKQRDALSLRTAFEFISSIARFAEEYLAPLFYIDRSLCFCSAKMPYFEYFPLINSRVHALGSTAKRIMNLNLRREYDSFLKTLSFRSLDCFNLLEPNTERPRSELLLSMTYYLVLQDRIDDALLYLKALAERAGDDDDGSSLTVDYLKCYFGPLFIGKQIGGAFCAEG